MNIRNIVTLTCIAAVGYAMYAMQGQQGESSSVGAELSEEEKLARIPTLQRQAAKSIARQIHDNKKIAVSEVGEIAQQDIAAAYYQLYRNEFPVTLENTIQDINYLLIALTDESYITYYNRGDEEEGDRVIERWTLQDGAYDVSQEIDTIARDDYPLVAAASSDNQLFAIGSQSSINIYQKGNDGNFTVLQRIAINNQVSENITLNDIILSNNADGRTVIGDYYNFEQDMSEPEVFTWQNNRFVSTQKIAYSSRIMQGDSITSISFDATGDYIISASYDNTIKLWTRDSNRAPFTVQRILTSPIALDPEAVHAGVVKTSFDDAWLVWGQENHVVIWSMDSAEIPQAKIILKQNITIAIGQVREFAFNIENNRLAAIGEQGFVIWEYNQQTNQWEQLIHTQIVGYRKIAFVQNDMLYAQKIDASIEIWWVPSLEDVWNHIMEKQAATEKQEEKAEEEAKKADLPKG